MSSRIRAREGAPAAMMASIVWKRQITIKLCSLKFRLIPQVEMGKFLAKSLSPKVSALRWKKSGLFALRRADTQHMPDSQNNL